MISFNSVTWYSQLTAIILGLVIFALGIYIGAQLNTSSPEIDPQISSEREKIIESFVWEVVPITTNEEIPESDVYLVVSFTNGSIERRLIDTVNGDCNQEEVEIELALNSEQLMCYFAGLGHKFRVIETENTYEVQQQTFEEASPYNEGLPLSEFETKETYSK